MTVPIIAQCNACGIAKNMNKLFNVYCFIAFYSIIPQKMKNSKFKKQTGEERRSMSIISGRNLALLSIIALYLSILSIIYLRFPELQPGEREHFKYPRTLDDAKKLGRILLRYKDQHFSTMLIGIAAVYLMLQSFAIPVALCLVCLCSAAGATVCYFLSYMFGRKLMMRYFPEKLGQWQKEVQKQADHLLNYIIFLRITPILPNWFINLASPVVNVPLMPFFFGTLLGVAPPSFLFIQAGTTLQMMTNANVVWSWDSIALLTFFALLSLAPVVYKQVLSRKSSTIKVD